jgi:hypothetical protein
MDYFRIARNPPRTDAKCGDHFLKTNLSGQNYSRIADDPVRMAPMANSM